MGFPLVGTSWLIFDVGAEFATSKSEYSVSSKNLEKIGIFAILASNIMENETVPDSIFICYRRNDAGYISGLIREQLARYFKNCEVFLDTHNLNGGDDFERVLKDKVKNSAVVVALIGRKWMCWRLWFRSDVLRKELESAIENNIAIIPVLFGTRDLPVRWKLPSSIKPILKKQKISFIFSEDFNYNFEQLCRAIEKQKQKNAQRKPPILKVLSLPASAVSEINVDEMTDATDTTNRSVVSEISQNRNIADLRWQVFQFRIFFRVLRPYIKRTILIILTIGVVLLFLFSLSLIDAKTEGRAKWKAIRIHLSGIGHATDALKTVHEDKVSWNPASSKTNPGKATDDPEEKPVDALHSAPLIFSEEGKDSAPKPKPKPKPKNSNPLPVPNEKRRSVPNKEFPDIPLSPIPNPTEL
ncbi:MAG: toll/interleukin-1 receptor domain-containing protein [Deltaproteobacteria bacterium]|nr:toll/interleukin-1 receptor domain-containing protein [Deltaproteobacteria bacterium]